MVTQTDPDDLADAWAAVHDATPAGWYVGRPSYHDERDEWTQYAFDPREVAKVGARSREWTAVADSEIGVLLEMARCLQCAPFEVPCFTPCRGVRPRVALEHRLERGDVLGRCRVEPAEEVARLVAFTSSLGHLRHHPLERALDVIERDLAAAHSLSPKPSFRLAAMARALAVVEA